MTTKDKCLAIQKMTSRGRVVEMLGITSPTLGHRLNGRFPWTEEEIKIINDKFDILRQIRDVESKLEIMNKRREILIESI